MPEPLAPEIAPLQDIVQTGALTVVLAFRVADQPGVRYRLMRADVDEGFREAAQGAISAGLRSLRGSEVLPYESGRLLATKEMFKWTPAESGLDSLGDTLRQPALLDSATFHDFDTKLDFYAFVFIVHGQTWAAFIRKAFQVHVSGIHRLIAVFRQQRLVKPSQDQRVLKFDERFDVVLQQEACYIVREAGFDDMFVDKTEWQARVPAQVDLLLESGIAVKNVDEFIEAIQTNLNMMKKLRRISESGYLGLITPQKVQELVEDYRLPETVLQDGQLYFDPKHRWEVLKILDDDYLRSGLTGRRYETNSKVTVAQ